MADYELGNRIYELRRAKGLSQKELGALLGVSNKAVSKWETGAAVPKTETLVKLASVFDISTEELINGKREKIETLDGLSEKTKNLLMKERIDSIESESKVREYRSAMTYLTALLCIYISVFVIVLFMTLLLRTIFIDNGTSYFENTMTVRDCFVTALFAALVPSGIYTGIYRFAGFIKNKSPAVIAVCCLLFFITVFVIIICGIVLIPQTVITSVKSIKAYKENADDRE